VAFLMISTVRYYSFKDLDMAKSRPRWMFLAAGALIWSIISYSEYVLLILATIYVASGPIINLVQLVRRFLPGSVTSSEPVHGNIRN